jgi:hypothetical protein
VNQEPAIIMGAEFVGMAKCVDGVLDVGGVKIDLGWPDIGVYVRRVSTDLRICEVIMTTHDGLAQEVLDRQNDEAAHHPQGPKEYWRLEMVGSYTTGVEGRLMTDADFEEYWAEGE